jgi:hypothetical protein
MWLAILGFSFELSNLAPLAATEGSPHAAVAAETFVVVELQFHQKL